MSTIQDVLKCIKQYQENGYNSYLIQVQRWSGYGKDKRYELRHRLATELAKDVERLENTAQGWADLVTRWKEFLSEVSDKNCMSGALTKMINEVEAMAGFDQALQTQEQVLREPATADSLTDDDADVAPSLRAPCQHVLGGMSDLPSPVGGSPRLFSRSVPPLSQGDLSPSFTLSDSEPSGGESSADEEEPDAVVQPGPATQNVRESLAGLGVMALLFGRVDAVRALIGPAAAAAFLQCNRMTDCLDRDTDASPVAENDSAAADTCRL